MSETQEKFELSEAARTALAEIARGGTPVWERTLTHPRYGEMTFRAKLPDNKAWLAHSIRTDQVLAEAGGGFATVVSPGTALFAASIAAMPKRTVVDGETIVQPGIFDPIVTNERQIEDPDTGDAKVERVFYDPESDSDQSLVMQAWLAFSEWRNELLRGVDDLGNSSGDSRGSESDASSLEPTASPSTIPA